MKNYQKIRSEFELYGYKVIDYDFDRPWGGFLVIDENQAQKFANQFFKGIDTESLKIGGKLSPKILIVNSNSRLSWQYHLRRAEIWSIQKGEVGIVRSDNDIENKVEIFSEGDQIRLIEFGHLLRIFQLYFQCHYQIELFQPLLFVCSIFLLFLNDIAMKALN